MNTHRCCSAAASDPRAKLSAAPATTVEPRRLTCGGRLLDVARWIVPGATMALVPKCPACLATYVAVWTGLGLSLAAATYLRWALLSLCVAALGYLAVRCLRRFAALPPRTA